MSSLRPFVLLAVILLVSASAQAVIIRHDRDDAAYIELGHELSGICHLNLQHEKAPPDGEGVLVDPLWVLTAAHVAVEVQPGHVLTVVGRDLTVQVEADEVFLHPQWEGGPHDIALVRLKRPVERIEPVPIYRGRDEEGQIIMVGGVGDFGTGKSGPVGNDGQLRAATNRIDEVSDNWLKFRFDDSEQASELEGISGPGDSGGPALLIDDDGRFVVGVSSGQSTRDTEGREGVYGVREYYTRVSSHATWIDVIVGEKPPSQE